MVLNYIWIGFFVIAFIVALIRTFGYIFRDWFAEIFGIIFDRADLDVFSAMVQSTFDMAETGITISIYLIGVMSLWLGIMKIGENSGAVGALSRATGPFFSKLFPELPKNHPAFGSMIMNFSANMLGLDNAATPLGLKAMDDLQKENKDKDTASNSMIMFLVLNTSGLTIIPISVLALRAASGAENPADVFLPILIATYCSTLAGLISVAVAQKINMFNRTILMFLGAITVFIAGIVGVFYLMTPDQVQKASSLGGNFILFFVILLFIYLGIRKKINIYESFIEGAKEGFQVAVKIIPYLVAMLVAIGVFRASGAMDFIVGGIGKFVALFTGHTEFVDALPTAFMKPLSGSGARGMMVEAMNHYGVDSFVAKLAATFQGSTETTFYTIAVYFGAVNIRRTRYTVTCGLIADLAGIVAAIFIAYLFFQQG
ncbi:MAG: spore maturation protein [Bacteroidetes bacterium]|nr:spore maturation protein [Bacteroidota bacterium]